MRKLKKAKLSKRNDSIDRLIILAVNDVQFRRLLRDRPEEAAKAIGDRLTVSQSSQLEAMAPTLLAIETYWRAGDAARVLQIGPGVVSPVRRNSPGRK